jgi:UDP-glucose 4-epimerase
MSARRILITGLASTVGGQLAQALERDPAVEAIVGIDTSDPQHELARTEFVRVDAEHALLRRIVEAAAIDTVIDTRLIDDPLAVSRRRLHEVNVLGTVNILAACEQPATPIRKLVVKSSAQRYGFGPDRPAFLAEHDLVDRPPASAVERELALAEEAVAGFAARNPRTTVTVLRFADGVGPNLRGAHLTLLSLPIVPAILGFDPRWQFIQEDDIVGALAHAAAGDLPGTYNAAADGVLVLSEVASLLGKPLLPVLPPWGTVFAASRLGRLGLPAPVETIRQLRFGRGLDNRRLKAAGYAYRYTSREALLKLREHQRLRPLLEPGAETYRYERQVEEFLRWSPNVRSAPRTIDGRLGPAADDADPLVAIDRLGAAELIEIIASLEPDALAELRGYEATHQARGAVLDALDDQLARKRGSEPGG